MIGECMQKFEVLLQTYYLGALILVNSKVTLESHSLTSVFFFQIKTQCTRKYFEWCDVAEVLVTFYTSKKDQKTKFYLVLTNTLGRKSQDRTQKGSRIRCPCPKY